MAKKFAKLCQYYNEFYNLAKKMLNINKKH